MNLVSGATGNVGREVVRALAAAGPPVRALSRRPPEGDSPWPDGVEVAIGDLNDPGSLSPSLAGVRGLFLLSGYDDVAGLLDAGREAGLERVVLLSSGAVEDAEVAAAAEPGYDESNVVVRCNAEAEQALRRSGLAWTVAAAGPQRLLPAERVRILGEVLGRSLRSRPRATSGLVPRCWSRCRPASSTRSSASSPPAKPTSRSSRPPWRRSPGTPRDRSPSGRPHAAEFA